MLGESDLANSSTRYKKNKLFCLYLSSLYILYGSLASFFQISSALPFMIDNRENEHSNRGLIYYWVQTWIRNDHNTQELIQRFSRCRQDRWERSSLPAAPGWNTYPLYWGTKRTANSTPAFMKIGDQKVQRTLRKQMVRGLLQDKKVPGTSTGTRAAAAPGPGPLGLPQDSWERARLKAPSPAKQGLSSTERDLFA